MRAGRPVPLRALALAALAACSSSSSPPAASAALAPAPASGPAAASALPAPRYLRWVPADTPYFYGVLAPPDPGHVEREYLASLAAYEKVLPALQKLERERPADLRRLSFKARLAAALLAEAGGRATRASLAAIGMDPVTVAAIYGAGVAPVVRVQLSDPERFTGALERIAARVGATRATLGERVYFTGKDDVIAWLMAVVDGDLVLAVLPADRRDQQARVVLAEAPPARSLATDRRLDAMATTYGFGPGGLGFADLASLSGALAGELPAGCADELRGFAEAVPRVLVGVTSATRQEMRVRSVVEMRADLAGKLRDLRGEVPRSEVTGSAPPQLEIAVALDVGALVRGLGAGLDRVRASPFRCPALAALNDLSRTQGKTLGQMGKALAGVRGASLAVRNIEGLTLGKADLFFLFGTDRPGDLLDCLAAAMGTRRPRLQPGDAPVELKVPLSSLGAVYGAVAPRAAGLSVGAEPAELTEMLSADAVDDPPMFFFRIDPGAVAQLRALIAGAEPGADPRMAAADPDLARQLAEIEGSNLDRFAEGITTARATQRGLEIDFVGRYPP